MIDVWDFATFDDDLVATLRDGTGLVREYLDARSTILRRREAGDITALYTPNPYAVQYDEFLNRVREMMKGRTIRAWHYTRLTDREVERLMHDGIMPSTFESAQRRLEAQISDGELSREIAEALLSASPLHDPLQHDSRVDKFWMTSHPLQTTSHDVDLLLNNWGGEVVYFWLENQRLKQIVSQIGKARVLEVSVPINATKKDLATSEAVIATFARTLGCRPDFDNFDLSVDRPLDASAIVAIHTEGDTLFSRIGNAYPTNFRSRRE